MQNEKTIKGTQRKSVISAVSDCLRRSTGAEQQGPLEKEYRSRAAKKAREFFRWGREKLSAKICLNTGWSTTERGGVGRKELGQQDTARREGTEKLIYSSAIAFWETGRQNKKLDSGKRDFD